MATATVGVVGGGVMGAGIAQTLLFANYHVCLKEIDERCLAQGVANVTALVEAAAKKGAFSEEEAQAKLGALQGTTSYSPFTDVEFVIEAVPEILSLKGEVLERLDHACPADAVIASNTSSLPISELAAFTRRPGRVVGMHWFYPAHRMRLVEVVPGLETTAATVEACLGLAKTLGKTPVIVKECAGFLVNRLMGAYSNEALWLIAEGNSPGQVDAAARELGLPMGPVELGDMVGWDTIFRSNKSLEKEYGHRFAVPALLEATVQAGQLGAKVGRGFYDYANGRPVRGPSPEPVPEAVMRLRLSLLNEGIRCLDEGVAVDTAIDTAMKLGAGLPKGPLEWADELGLDSVLSGLEKLSESLGERFLPSALLRRKVAARHLGKSSARGFYVY